MRASGQIQTLGIKNTHMLDEEAKKQIAEIWDNHVIANKSGFEKEGGLINNIDDSRLYAIEVVKIIIHNFMKGDFNIHDFKTSLDSYNKHNNLWGFTAKLGQMYFNQIIQANENNIEKLTTLLKDAITEPKNLRDALSKIESLEKLTAGIYTKSKDKHNAPYPGAVGYFLSYFWQIHNNQKWPILYPSLINSYNEMGIWKEHKTQKDTYEFYYNLTGDLREVIKSATGTEVNNWDVEHAFWNYKNKPKPVPVSVPAKAEAQYSASPEIKPVKETEIIIEEQEPATLLSSESFDIREYLIPRLSRLLDMDTQETSAAPRNVPYEQLVAESFSQLGFEVKTLEQGRRKNPFAIMRFREENIAFIIDAKASSHEYFEQNDDRVIKEYIKDQCKALKMEGYKKIGFMVVCSSFQPDQNEFINFITWNTSIKKVTLLTSEALLYLLAFKNRNKLNLMNVVEKIIGLGHLVTGKNVAAEIEK
jgi:hypothetical protein